MIPGWALRFSRCSTSPMWTKWYASVDTIRACHRLAGTWIPVRRLHGHGGQRCAELVIAWLAISPRLLSPQTSAERYLDTVYYTNWVHDLYGEDVLSSDQLISASGSA